MSASRQTPEAPLHGRSPDDLDGWLRAFFRAQMPSPWPACKATAATTPAPEPLPPPGPRTWSQMRSRFALAASVAVLLIGSWFLAGRFAGYTPSIGTADPTIGTAGGNTLPVKKYRIDMDPGDERDGRGNPRVKRITIEIENE